MLRSSAPILQKNAKRNIVRHPAKLSNILRLLLNSRAQKCIFAVKFKLPIIQICWQWPMTFFITYLKSLKFAILKCVPVLPETKNSRQRCTTTHSDLQWPTATKKIYNDLQWPKTTSKKSIVNHSAPQRSKKINSNQQ